MRFLFAVIFCLQCCLAGTLQENRWDQASVPAKNKRMVDKIVDRYEANINRYKAVDAKTDVPHYVIFCLHNMESGGSFRHHLHEGSPLSGRTRWVPKGRPKTSSPPFSWEYSAQDALNYDKMGNVKWAELDATLYAIERYNGTGYLRYHKNVPSPYLFGKTNLEKPGKYVSDGKWSSTARTQQVGCVAILKTMEKRGIINFDLLKRSTPPLN